MTSSPTNFYSLTNQSGSDNNLSSGKSMAGTSSIGYKSTQQPSFTASTSSLPGALGIGSSSSTFSASTLVSSPLTNQERSKAANHTPSTSISRLLGESAGEGKSPTNQMQTTSSDSLRSDGRGIKLMMDSLDSAELSQDRLTHTNGGGSSSSGRNFLVPIGATGARQKLSILSASQRPMVGQKAFVPQTVLPQRPRTSSERSRGLEDEGPSRRRPQTGEQNGRNDASPSSIPLSYSAELPRNLRRPSTGTDESSRRLQTEQNPPDIGNPSQFGEWKQDNRSITTPTQDRPHPPLNRHASSDSSNSMGILHPSSRSYPSLAKEAQSASGSSNRSGKVTRRYVSEEHPVETSTSEYHAWEYHLPQESPPRTKQTGRPSSSSGRDRAAKLGAGFKSMFSTKSNKDQSPKMAGQSDMTNSSSFSSTTSSFSQGSPHSASQTSTPRKQNRRPSTASASIAHHSPQKPTAASGNVRLPIKHTFVDLNTAQSAGWTTSQDTRQQHILTSTLPPSSPPVSRLQSRVFVNGNERLKSLDGAPSLDFALPASSPFMEGFSASSFSSLSQEPVATTRGLGTTRMAKGPATTGLNLEAAGHSIPLLQHMIDQEVDESATRSAVDKSLPPTPDLDSSTFPNTGEGRQAQQRNHSETSTWSESTILGSPAIVSSPGMSASPASLNQTRPFRGASFSSLADSSRRGSAATTYSEHNGSDTQQHSNASRRPSSSAQSTSGESNYSAPNSSRAWSPSVFDKPIVPITSPLLASVLSQQQLSSENILSQLRKVVSPISGPLSVGSFVQTESSLTEDQSTTTPSTPTSNRSRSSTVGKPDLPTRSKERPQTLLADPATLAKLDQGSLAPSQSVFAAALSDGSTDTAKTPTRQDKVVTSTESINRSLYVPPGALTYTRKGTAVRPTVTKQSQPSAIESNDTSDTPRASLSSSGPRLGYSDRNHDAEKNSDGHVITFTSTDFESCEEEISMDTVNLLPSSAWMEVEAALIRFKTISMQNTPSDKGNLLRSVLLPFLALESETPTVDVCGSGPFQSSKSRRSLFFEWIQHLLMELQTIQTSADRGAILESIACIIESRTFSAPMFHLDEEDEKKFYSVFGHILNYAIGELNKKGVYQNTLIFSGRLLAVAFFRVGNVASKLLRALPVNRFALERVASEAKWDVNNLAFSDWETYKQRFPPLLTDFCFQDARSYLKMLDSHTNASSIQSSMNEQINDDRFLVQQEEVEVEMSGNWLRRWQSDDSELFFSFCRNYHRQLAGFLTTGRGWESKKTLFFGGPGYAHLATCIHQKCLSLVHRDILSVTTLSSQKNFNPGETANVLSGSTAGKPRHLEAANRRCTAIIVDIVRAPLSHPLIFGPMLGIHVKSLIKRTSLYDVQGVFCLLDWLDGVLGHMESAELPVEKLVDIEFIIETVWLLLKDADHALALMRTIAFCYSNFAVLISTTKNRVRFCEEILLNPKIFQKLFLSWSFTIRAYFLHLLVFRLARINDFVQPEDDVKGKTAVSVARLFNQRLDEIRRRHDELSPSPSTADSGSEDDAELTRFKTRPQSFVSTIKHAPANNKHGSPGAMTKAERILGIGLPDPALSTKGEIKAQSRAAKWLRALGGKGVSKGGKRIEGQGSGPYLDSSPTTESRLFGGTGFGESPARMPKVEEQDLFSDEDDLEDDDEFTGEDGGDATPKAEGQFEFSFDAQSGHSDHSPVGAKSTSLESDEQEKALNDHISRKLSFDLQSPASTLPPPITEGSPDKLPLSVNYGPDRISRAFSKRQSILPGPAFNLVNHGSESEEEDAIKDGLDATELDPSGFFAHQKILKRRQQVQKSDPYSQSLHIYAVQSLREYEQTVLEHDEFFSKQADTSNPQVPRLPIQWPAMWSE